MPQALIATKDFVCKIDGQRYVVHADQTRIPDDHPLAKHHPRAFRPLDFTYDVERATKAPGEKRSYRPRKSRDAEADKTSDDE